MPQVIGISPNGIQVLINYLRSHLVTDEPMDPFELCNRQKLDSSLKTPFQRPQKENFLDELIEKASLLFYLLVENHVLPTNGNKRLATHALLSMAYLNNYDVTSTDQELYDLSIKITRQVKQGLKQEVILKELCEFLSQNLEYVDHQVPKIIQDDFLTYLFS